MSWLVYWTNLDDRAKVSRALKFAYSKFSKEANFGGKAMADKITRRELLKNSAAVPISLSLPVAAGSGYIATSSPANAVEPVTVVIAAAAVVGAISSLLSSGDSGGLDPASQAYFERILANQEIISNQINAINAQLETLAQQIAVLPPRTVTLDRRVRAKGVYHSAAALEIAFLRSTLAGNPQFGDTDRRSFEDIIESIRISASDHVALVQEVGQSIDVVVAVDALRIAVEAAVNSARLAGFTGPGDKRALEIVLGHVDTAARNIDSGTFSPTYGGFRQSGAEIRSDLLKASAAIADFSQDSFYQMNLDALFYRRVTPTESNQVGFTYHEDQVWESCGGRYYEPSANSDRGGMTAEFDPNRHSFSVFTAECRAGYRTVTRRRAGRAVVSKAYLDTPDDDLSHFVITVNPEHPSSSYVALVSNFNEVKRRAQLHHATDLLLKRTLARTQEIASEIGEL